MHGKHSTGFIKLLQLSREIKLCKTTIYPRYKLSLKSRAKIFKLTKKNDDEDDDDDVLQIGGGLWKAGHRC